MNDTLDFAYSMHKGINDWCGLPYITHPVWVMLHLPVSCSDDDRRLALLHDVVEDCADRLFEYFNVNHREAVFPALRTHGFSTYLTDGLRLLTRDMWSLSYLDYVRNIAASGHTGAIWVKYTDNMHNTHPDRIAMLTPELQAKAATMAPRYEKSKAILRPNLGVSNGTLE